MRLELSWQIYFAIQYLERRECEYDQKISVDFYKVLVLHQALF